MQAGAKQKESEKGAPSTKPSNSPGLSATPPYFSIMFSSLAFPLRVGRPIVRASRTCQIGPRQGLATTGIPPSGMATFGFMQYCCGQNRTPPRPFFLRVLNRTMRFAMPNIGTSSIYSVQIAESRVFIECMVRFNQYRKYGRLTSTCQTEVGQLNYPTNRLRWQHI